MTREQRKFHKRCAAMCVVCGVICFAIVYGVSYLVNVVFGGAL